MANSNDIFSQPYAEFLETAIKELTCADELRTIVIMGITKNTSGIYTAHWGSSIPDLFVAAGMLQSEAVQLEAKRLKEAEDEEDAA